MNVSRAARWRGEERERGKKEKEEGKDASSQQHERQQEARWKESLRSRNSLLPEEKISLMQCAELVRVARTHREMHAICMCIILDLKITHSKYIEWINF